MGSLVPTLVRIDINVSFEYDDRNSALTSISVTCSSDSLFKQTYARKFVPTNMLPKPFGRVARPVRPLPLRRGSMVVESAKADRAGMLKGEVEIVGLS